MKPLEEGRGLERMLLVSVLMTAALGARGNRGIMDALRQELRNTFMLSRSFLESGRVPTGGEEDLAVEEVISEIRDKYGPLIEEIANRYRKAA